MNTKLQVLVMNNEAVFGHNFERALFDKGYEVITALKSKEARVPVKTTGMFIAAPFIALGYIIALPFIGLYQFAKLAYEAFAKTHPMATRKFTSTGLFAKNVGLFLAAPFIALAYIIALPFVSFYMFIKLAREALR